MLLIYIYIYIYIPIGSFGIMDRVFAHGPRDMGSNLRSSHTKNLKNGT